MFQWIWCCVDGVYVPPILLLLTTRSISSVVRECPLYSAYTGIDWPKDKPAYVKPSLISVRGKWSKPSKSQIGRSSPSHTKNGVSRLLHSLSWNNDTGTAECASFHPGGVTCDDARLKHIFSCSAYLEATLNCKSWSAVARVWPVRWCRQQKFSIDSGVTC